MRLSDVPKHCQRCGDPLPSWTMSKFNNDIICMPCKKDEREAPNYKRADDAECRAVRAGNNYNYPGIGLAPEDRAFLAERRQKRKHELAIFCDGSAVCSCKEWSFTTAYADDAGKWKQRAEEEHSLHVRWKTWETEAQCRIFTAGGQAMTYHATLYVFKTGSKAVTIDADTQAQAMTKAEQLASDLDLDDCDQVDSSADVYVGEPEAEPCPKE